jgi:hypothetical protein
MTSVATAQTLHQKVEFPGVTSSWSGLHGRYVGCVLTHLTLHARRGGVYSRQTVRKDVQLTPRTCQGSHRCDGRLTSQVILLICSGAIAGE